MITIVIDLKPNVKASRDYLQQWRYLSSNFLRHSNSTSDILKTLGGKSEIASILNLLLIYKQKKYYILLSDKTETNAWLLNNNKYNMNNYSIIIIYTCKWEIE